MEEGGGSPRPVVYCIVPAELAGELHEPLRRHFRDDARFEVIVERRETERRQRTDRREAPTGSPAGGAERRALRAASGRRIAERRASLVPTSVPELPEIAAPYADQLSFVERFEPSTVQREDADTARLIARIQGGDRSRFDQLYMRYFDRVYAYLRVTLQDPHDAEDVTQDVFLRVLEALPRYERRTAPFRAWLFRIVRNCAINRIRQRQRLTVESSESVSERHAIGLIPSADSLRWLSDRDLLSLIEELPLSQRQVIVLRYMMEFRSTEIAEIIERSPAAVRQLHQRAMRFLRKRTDNHEDDQDSEHTRVQRDSMVQLPRRAPVTRARQMSLR
jgi:RNA polymerase sigma-70 factor, ECF subfamily